MTAFIHEKQLSLEFIQQHINEVSGSYAHIPDCLNGQTELFPVMQLKQVVRLFPDLRRSRLVVGLLIQLQYPPACYILLVRNRIEFTFARLLIIPIQKIVLYVSSSMLRFSE